MPRTMASLSLGLLLLVALVSGQSVQPSNASLPATESVFTQLTITGATSLSPSVFNIAPLTEQVGLGGNANAVSVRITFPLVISWLVLGYIKTNFGCADRPPPSRETFSPSIRSTKTMSPRVTFPLSAATQMSKARTSIRAVSYKPWGRPSRRVSYCIARRRRNALSVGILSIRPYTQ